MAFAWSLAAPVVVASDVPYSGASYLADTGDFASGFSYGMWVQAINIADSQDSDGNATTSPRQVRMRKCFIGTAFNSEDLHQAVQRHLRANPEDLVEPAFVAVLKTFVELCPNQP